MKTKTIFNLKRTLAFIAVFAFLQSCEKEINEGAKLKGKIIAVDLNNDSTFIAQESVFLVSKTKEQFSLKRKSGKKGGFKFKNIPAGEYSLMVYTNRINSSIKDSCIVKTIKISEQERVIELEPIITLASIPEN